MNFSGNLVAGSAVLTGILATIPKPTVKPVEAPRRSEIEWIDLVRFAEGPREFARRDRYVQYEFGSGSRRRLFWAGHNDPK